MQAVQHPEQYAETIRWGALESSSSTDEEMQADCKQTTRGHKLLCCCIYLCSWSWFCSLSRCSTSPPAAEQKPHDTITSWYYQKALGYCFRVKIFGWQKIHFYFFELNLSTLKDGFWCILDIVALWFMLTLNAPNIEMRRSENEHKMAHGGEEWFELNFTLIIQDVCFWV